LPWSFNIQLDILVPELANECKISNDAFL
jgi:hypothetical protein